MGWYLYTNNAKNCHKPQGDLVDQYLRHYKMCIAIISSTMTLANILGSIIAVQLYLAGGWLLVGPGMAVLNLLPLVLLPALTNVQKSLNKSGTGTLPVSGDVASGLLDTNKLSGLRKLAFVTPDLAVFLTNLTFNLLIHCLPTRMVKFTGNSLDTAVLFLSLLNVFSLVGALILGYLADRKTNIFTIMIAGNVVFTTGCILAFGSTTTFLSFTSGFEVGSVLVGFGDAAIIHLAIMSKFALYERWGVPKEGLGNRAATVNNLVLNLSVAGGAVLSGLTVSRASEVPALGAAGATFLVVSLGLIFCRVVNEVCCFYSYGEGFELEV